MFSTRLVPTCTGKALVVAGRPEGARPELAIVSQLAESEAREDAPLATVCFEIADGGDLQWLEPSIERLVALGRSVSLRSARVLPKRLVAHAAERRCRVELITAHHRPEVQRALVRPDADAVNELLRHAQHLLAVGLTVTARVAPIVAGLHDAPGGIAPLFKAIAAANLQDISLRVGALSQPVVAALAHSMDAATKIFWARAYGQALPENASSVPARGALWTLRSQTARALEQGLARLAQDQGLRVNGCGCTHACHLDGVSFGAQHPSPLLRSLFDHAESDLPWDQQNPAPNPSGRADTLVVDTVRLDQRVRTRHRRGEDRHGSQEEQAQERSGHQLVLLN